MANLVFLTLASLDGYTEDEDGAFDWAAPDAEVHEFVNELDRPIRTHLYGRRMFETMAVWQTIGDQPGVSAVESDFAEQWRSKDKVVYSRTLDAVSVPRTRLEREFDPGVIEHMKAVADHDIGIGGPELAGHAFRAGLVDEVHLFLCPVTVGGGTPAFPSGVRLDLELLDERRFGSGVVHTHHRVR